MDKHMYRLQRLCEFATSKTQNKYYQYKILVEEFGLLEEEYPVDDDAIVIAKNIKESLIFIADRINDLENNTFAIDDTVKRYYYFRKRNGKIDISKGRWGKVDFVSDNEEAIKMNHIIVDFLYDIAALPIGTLRICKNYTCNNPFVSMHKKKEYCCNTCRNTTNTRNTRFKKRII